MDDAEYTVDIRDQSINTHIVEGARVNHVGLYEILTRFGGASSDQFSKFIHAVEDYNEWTLYNSADDNHRYYIHAVKLVKTPVKTKINWTQIEADWVKAFFGPAPSGRISHDEFWNDRGGRDRYFTKGENGVWLAKEYFEE